MAWDKVVFDIVGLSEGLLGSRGADVLTDTEVDWDAVLSPAEKQRLGVARILLLSPRFAVLDECMNGLDLRSIRRVHAECTARGITVITVAKERRLLQFHSRVLTLTGGGRWTIEPVDCELQTELLRTQSEAVELEEERFASEQANGRVAEEYTDERSKDYEASYTKRREALSLGIRERIGILLRILVPKLHYHDRGMLLLVAQFSLLIVSVNISASVLSRVVSRLPGLAMQGDVAGYVRMTAAVMSAKAVTFSCDAMLSVLNTLISMHWSHRLTTHVVDRYMERGRFYAVRELDRRVSDAHTRITQELIDCCDQLSQMLKGDGEQMMSGARMSITQSPGGGGMPSGGVIRPIYESIVCTVLLARVNLPRSGLLAMWGYGVGTVLAIKLLAPDFSLFAREQSRRAGQFRSVHARVKASAEPIGFCGGGAPERVVVDKAFQKTVQLSKLSMNQRGRWMPVDHFLRWVAPSSVQSLLRFLWARAYGSDDDVMANEAGTDIANTGSYISSLIMRSFQTYYSLFSTYEQFATLLGTVIRVTDLIQVLDDLQPAASSNSSSGGEQDEDTQDTSSTVPATPAFDDSESTAGGTALRLTGCDIVTPRGRCLAQGLSVTLSAGGDMGGNLAVIGPPGSGKSAFCRVITGLWPLPLGEAAIPQGRVYTCPQKLLVPTSAISLRDFLTYPTVLGMDEEREKVLHHDLQTLRVEGIVDREGLDAVQAWHTRLSFGEQQSLAIVRLLFHCGGGGGDGTGSFAIIDDCVSGIKPEILEEVYALFVERGIRVVTCIEALTPPLDKVHGRELRLGQRNAQGWRLEDLREC